MPRRLIITCAVIVVSLTVTGMFTPARAAQPNLLCLYTDRDQGGREQCFGPLQKHNLDSYDLDNKVSSIWNETSGTTWCAFLDLGQQGYELAIGPKHHFADLARDIAPDGRSWNDRISSVGPCR